MAAAPERKRSRDVRHPVDWQVTIRAKRTSEIVKQFAYSTDATRGEVEVELRREFSSHLYVIELVDPIEADEPDVTAKAVEMVQGSILD